MKASRRLLESIHFDGNKFIRDLQESTRGFITVRMAIGGLSSMGAAFYGVWRLSATYQSLVDAVEKERELRVSELQKERELRASELQKERELRASELKIRDSELQKERELRLEQAKHVEDRIVAEIARRTARTPTRLTV